MTILRTSMIMAGLLAGLAVAPPTPAHAADGLLDLEVCNKSGKNATVAVSYMEPGASNWVTRGWFAVYSGSCIIVGNTDNANFYMYAETLNDGAYVWTGEHTLCVQYPGPFTSYESGDGRTCNANEELRSFKKMHADEAGKYTWTLNP